MRSIASGSAASELVVAKAIDTGSAIAFAKRSSGTRATSATGSSTSSRNASSATYKVTSTLARLTSTPMPMWPTV